LEPLELAIPRNCLDREGRAILRKESFWSLVFVFVRYDGGSMDIAHLDRLRKDHSFGFKFSRLGACRNRITFVEGC
jgi:hypothetical protein